MEQFVERLMQLSPFLVQCITYLVIFLGAIIEGIPPFGFLYPCWLLLCISGFLANIHLISLPIIITYAIVGAFIGEVFSYTL
ncbi:hypothetical protein IJM86_07465 [bacterium]|nr:hypothetical protein [bacterium]